jgi:hypothetical protein
MGGDSRFVEDFVGFRICKSYFWEAEEGHRIDV